MEKRIPCPHCGSLSQCIEDEQKEYSSYMCFSCGFMSDSRFVKGYTENLKSQPALLNKVKFFDKMRKIYWYPTIINMGPVGLIYPEGTEEDWNWRFAKVVDVFGKSPSTVHKADFFMFLINKFGADDDVKKKLKMKL